MEKLLMMVSTINLNMEKYKEAAIDTLKVQITSIATFIKAIAIKFKLSNQRLHAIAQFLEATHQCTMEEHYLNSKPLRGPQPTTN